MNILTAIAEDIKRKQVSKVATYEKKEKNTPCYIVWS